MRTKNKWALVAVACVLCVGGREAVGHHQSGYVGQVERNGSNTSDGEYRSSPVPFRSEEKSEFPDDLFTEEQLKQGALVLHFIGALYSFAMIGIVCSDYFLPSVDCICLGLNLSQDVAAATFMSFATTAPELFTVLIGTFITESDVGLGAVIGSGMFNILGVATFGGLAAIRPIQLDWWPLIRDSSIYLLSLTALVVVIYDRTVTVPDAALLVGCYFLYFFLMLYNQSCRKVVKSCIVRFRSKKRTISEPIQPVPDMKFQLEVPVVFVEDESFDEDVSNIKDNTSYKAYFINHDRRSLSRKSIRSEKGSFMGKVGSESEKEGVQTQNARLEVPADAKEVQIWTVQKSESSIKSVATEEEVAEEEHEEFTGVDLMHIPEGSFWDVAAWLFSWPGSFLLYVTVPDCRVVRWRKYYPLTFVMCVFWIGITSYFGNWMLTVIGS
ncbi:UNVERIFIED_CONTAM: hypothetical protein PYX00_004860 [Menopon gallinae]|uniref:Sodium/calcium exchanger membrane region domain-containing protein n=1 Tax=Menopon gallinae TaxID=328185 RepID=A0AAW2I6U6_9NEOP